MNFYAQCWTSDEYAPDRQGYMRVWFEGRATKAHRLSFFLHHGYWPGVCRHSCDNPPCYNPTHLLDGTVGDNNRDRDSRGRNGYAIKTHCKHGHPYDEANTYTDSRGHRHCRACRRRDDQKRRQS